MNITSLIRIILCVATVSTAGCKEHVPSDLQTQTPYPPLAEQRAKLSTKQWVMPTRILDSIQIINDLEYLASDACEGRLPGTAGHTRALERILTRMRAAGVDSFDRSLTQVFLGSNNQQGTNVVGWVKGTTYPEKYIVISAHYDHLGKTSTGATYYGADDNASGVACLLALAAYFKNNPHPYSLIFAAFDKEETRFEGAYHFVDQFRQQGRLAAVVFNLNMDMIARSDNNEIFASGIGHYPKFKYAVDQVQPKTNVKLLLGHDGQQPEADWTNQSDHWAFHQRSIPFIYIGVEDHPDYHKPTDTYDRINYSRYMENCNIAALLVKALKL